MQQIKILFLFLILISLAASGTEFAQGRVFLVLGSDTAIWDGLNTDRYYCTMDLKLYDNPAMNSYKVMDPAFRSQFKDSYGQSMKMTWWMMAGNMFRFATNKNIPVDNTMTLYLMKKYHGEEIKKLGDELSLHYHTFTWTDYDHDGKYYWNQAKNFTECREDFDATMAQYLLEENVFPVSFRSGWHYMDDEWQNYLDKLIPYCLHNDYPHVRASVTEPIDNVYDWSKASAEFVPYHPSLSNYQLPGNGKSYDTRSIYMATITQAQMDTIFAKANRGIDQVPCIWAHLPETDFPQNMKRVDSLAHISASRFPKVKFSYCTAVEAMQKWRKGSDTTAPSVTFDELTSGDNVSFQVTTNETIFQAEPFVAVKDIYERYSILKCTKLSDNKWVTASVSKSILAKAGVALTDTLGNLATKFIDYLPDDLFIDNQDKSYTELSGTWSTSSTRAWGTDSRQSVLSANDTSKVHWTPVINKSGLYNLYFQAPKINNAADKLSFRIFSDNQLKQTVDLSGPFAANDWIYISTSQMNANPGNFIEMIAPGKEQAGKIVSSDVIKISALIKERSIFLKDEQQLLGAVSEDDSLIYNIRVENHGIGNLTISDLSSINRYLKFGVKVPLVILGMNSAIIPVTFFSDSKGDYLDTVVIKSDDPLNPISKIPFSVQVQSYYKIVDNDDVVNYSESGGWSQSNAQAWGNSSRYIQTGKGASAVFKLAVKKTGNYEIFEIVPKTTNAVDNATYQIIAVGKILSSLIINQNTGSGNWVSLGSFQLQENQTAEVKVIDNGNSNGGLVLRADAVKFQLLETTAVEKEDLNSSIKDFELYQNYPNPYNAGTRIKFRVPFKENGVKSPVELKIFDILGHEIITLVNEEKAPGYYEIDFSGRELASGIYICRLMSGGFVKLNKMILMK